MVSVNNLLLLVEFNDSNIVKFTFKRQNGDSFFQKIAKLNDKCQDELLRLINMQASLRDTIYIVCSYENKKVIMNMFPRLCERTSDILDLDTFKIMSTWI